MPALIRLPCHLAHHHCLGSPRPPGSVHNTCPTEDALASGVTALHGIESKSWEMVPGAMLTFASRGEGPL